MILAASWVMTYFIHGMVCGAIAAVSRFLPTSAQSRCRIWRIAILAPLLTASISIAVNRRSALRVPGQSQSVNVQMIRRNGAPPVRIETRKDSLAMMTSFMVIAFVTASSAGLLKLAVQRGRTSRRLASRVSCDAGLGLVSAISMSEWLQVPVALRGGEVCVPASFNGLSASEQRSVLLHEKAHIVRKDPEWLDIARAIASMFWWQPFNTYLTRRLELDSELAADELAMSSGADGPSLVRALSQFAATLENGVIPGAALIRNESPLVERAHLILEGTRPGRWAGVSYLLVASIVALLAFAPMVPAGADKVVEETSVILR
jgi:beta-lactamase regulating signal transducer with metallopeptidase domain